MAGRCWRCWAMALGIDSGISSPPGKGRAQRQARAKTESVLLAFCVLRNILRNILRNMYPYSVKAYGFAASHLATTRFSTHPWLLGSAVGLLGIFSALSAPASAAKAQQIASDTFALNPIPAGTGFTYGPALTFTAQPCDPALGTLNSATIQWITSGTGAMTTGLSAGNFNFSFGGTNYANTSSYDDYGNGTGDGSGANSSFTVAIPPTGSNKTFTQAGP
jgi:hypothetical protein